MIRFEIWSIPKWCRKRWNMTDHVQSYREQLFTQRFLLQVIVCSMWAKNRSNPLFFRERVTRSHILRAKCSMPIVINNLSRKAQASSTDMTTSNPYLQLVSSASFPRSWHSTSCLARILEYLPSLPTEMWKSLSRFLPLALIAMDTDVVLWLLWAKQTIVQLHNFHFLAFTPVQVLNHSRQNWFVACCPPMFAPAFHTETAIPIRIHLHHKFV